MDDQTTVVPPSADPQTTDSAMTGNDVVQAAADVVKSDPSVNPDASADMAPSEPVVDSASEEPAVEAAPTDFGMPAPAPDVPSEAPVAADSTPTEETPSV